MKPKFCHVCGAVADGAWDEGGMVAKCLDCGAARWTHKDGGTTIWKDRFQPEPTELVGVLVAIPRKKGRVATE